MIIVFTVFLTLIGSNLMTAEKLPTSTHCVDDYYIPALTANIG